MDHNPSSSRSKFCLVNNNDQRLSNIYQGFSPFLDQISTKNAMSLVNELCHMHKFKPPEYELTNVEGPENAKVFTVYLKLGESEKHQGQGSSIRNAQHNAALNALKKTRFKLPTYNSRWKNNQKSNGVNNSKKKIDKIHNCSSKLNSAFMKKSFQPKNELNMNKNNQPLHHESTNNFPITYQRCCCGSNQSDVHYYNIPANITYFYPRYCYDLFTNKHYLIYELINPGYINIPSMNYSPYIISKNKIQIEPELNEKKLSDNLFVANVEVTGAKFSGYGKTSQEARNTAAGKALDYLKENLFKKLTLTTSVSGHNDPITLVHKIADRNRLKVNFDLIDSSGPVHLPNFRFYCKLMEMNGKVLLQTEGKDHSKKLAKKMAAQYMIKEIENKNFSEFVWKSERSISPLNNDKIGQKEDSISIQSNEILDLISNKSLTLLYELSRNMSLKNPFFQYNTLNNNHPITKRYAAMLKLEPNQIYRIETTLFFDQITPQKVHCSIKTFGFSLTQRIAKQISAFICLLKIGLKVPRLEQADPLFVQSLQFSLLENWNFCEDMNEKIKLFNSSQDLNVFYENFSEEKHNLDKNVEFKINYQFVLFILKKFYYYILKEPNKNVDMINQKIKFLIPNFKNNHNFQFDHFNEESIQKLISSLNMKKYWDHLKLLEKLLIMGTEFETDPVMNFRCHICTGDTITESTMISFISVRLNNSLTRENFDLIQKNFVTYGFGLNEDEAREVASLRTLNNLASNSFKYYIEIKNKQSNLDSNSVEQKESKEKIQSSRPSTNQLKSKQCLAYMYQACRDIFIHKPEFIYHKWDESNEPELFCSRCIINFKQEFNNYSAKLVILGISTSKRLSRTITAFIFLSLLNISPLSLSKFDVFQIPDFEKYLKYSIQQNHFKIIPQASNIQNLIIYSEEQKKEIYRNMEFVQYLLRDIYQSFLRNQKRSDPSCLFSKIEDKLFEYHNHQKQIMDQSDSFDRWSEHVLQWINNLMNKFDKKKYWDHLQLISIIGSTLNYDLYNVMNPMIFDFKCKFTEIDLELSNEVNKGFIAVITIHCSSTELIDQYALLQKEFLSYSMDIEEDEAREFSSYKALRYLAINFWKS